MDNNILQYLIAILLPQEISDCISELQEKYKCDRWNITVAPHITLVPPGRAITDIQRAALMVRGIGENFRRFEIKSCGVGAFKNASNTIFAKLSTNHELFKLHCALIEEAPNFMKLEARGPGFYPHITISNKIKDAEVNKIIAQLKKELDHFSFICNNFSLLTKNPENENWMETETVFLQF